VSTKKVKVGIIGASGYSGEELIRLLLRHPNCEISFITSRKYDGKLVHELFPRFAGTNLKFISPSIELILKSHIDLVFLALPHGLASEFAIPLYNNGIKIIDISADFRLKDINKYKQYYGNDHPAPGLLNNVVYGLPELYREEIKKSDFIACPGCYPTSIILALAPLLKNKIIKIDGIVISSGSGVTGAGRKADLPYIFPECNESFRAYAPTQHRHLPEIEQELALNASIETVSVNFIPHLVPMNRGINSTIIASLNSMDTADSISKIYNQYYENEYFIRILNTNRLSDTKNVTMSNFCEIGYSINYRTNSIIITSAIDNLCKGSSGQAIQNMNIMFDLNEQLGLI